ncbi:acyltransferase [Muribaculum intestinale]|nr:acyltransferase [Muribaculum intestinale]
MKYAECGENLSIGQGANISIEKESSIKIGNNCDILGMLIAKCGSKITIGNYTTIRGNSVIGSAEGITIGNHVIISNNVHIYDNNNHPTPPHERLRLCESGFYSDLWHWKHSESAAINIEDNVWIGERATILKGVSIGHGSIIACDSVVTKAIPPNSIAAGNPAKVVKKIDSENKKNNENERGFY